MTEKEKAKVNEQTRQKTLEFLKKMHSRKELFTDRRWTDPPKGIPGEKIRESTDEEKRQHRKSLERILREKGFLKEGEELKGRDIE